ncbi:titin [Nonomuraea solani]|uniref:Titin n=1 Tax=Nonomuraea solani TaxID=1144553 RepID=A0A1H6D3I7_9ACTN|nr:titin [Nonomuraea solani]
MRVEGAKNDVQGNRIGTHISGTVAVPNGSGGVLLSGGNANKVAGNLISGNTTGPGVEAHGTAPASVITGNLIGTSTSGAAPLPNHVGIRIGSAGNQIGGTTSAARNVISGNAQHGIDAHAGAADLRIQGNLIGAGVWIEGDDSSIGGDKPEVPPNTIWDNVGEGVYVTPSGVGNAILRNSIHHSGGLGIDLDPVGVAGIDLLDPDVGANDQQNYAIITSANTVGGQTIIGWDLISLPNAEFRIEFFVNAACDGTNGEGRTYLGEMSATTGPAGFDSGTAWPTVTAPVGSQVVATVTQIVGPAQYGATSEFSVCVTVT